METKWEVYKRSREIVLSKQLQRPDVLQRGTERAGPGLLGLVTALKYWFMATFWSTPVGMKEGSGKEKEDKEEWILWIYSLRSVLQFLFLSVKASCWSQGHKGWILYLCSIHSYKDYHSHGAEASMIHSLIRLLSPWNSKK